MAGDLLGWVRYPYRSRRLYSIHPQGAAFLETKVNAKVNQLRAKLKALAAEKQKIQKAEQLLSQELLAMERRGAEAGTVEEGQTTTATINEKPVWSAGQDGQGPLRFSRGGDSRTGDNFDDMIKRQQQEAEQQHQINVLTGHQWEQHVNPTTGGWTPPTFQRGT